MPKHSREAFRFPNRAVTFFRPPINVHKGSVSTAAINTDDVPPYVTYLVCVFLTPGRRLAIYYLSCLI